MFVNAQLADTGDRISLDVDDIRETDEIVWMDPNDPERRQTRTRVTLDDGTVHEFFCSQAAFDAAAATAKRTGTVQSV